MQVMNYTPQGLAARLFEVATSFKNEGDDVKPELFALEGQTIFPTYSLSGYVNLAYCCVLYDANDYTNSVDVQLVVHASEAEILKALSEGVDVLRAQHKEASCQKA